MSCVTRVPNNNFGYIFFTEIPFVVLKKWVTSWSHASLVTNVKTLLKNFWQSFQKHWGEGKRENKNCNCKAFCVKRKRNNPIDSEVKEIDPCTKDFNDVLVNASCRYNLGKIRPKDRINPQVNMNNIRLRDYDENR